MRFRQADAYGPAELHQMWQLMPHLQPAVRPYCKMFRLEALAASAAFCNDQDAVIGNLSRSLREIHGMTRSEAMLTQAPVNGQSLREFSEMRSTTLNTVTTQLKSAAAKAGAKRRGDLVLTGQVVLIGAVQAGVASV